MTRVPFYVLEEHHEAFFVWHYAIRHGQMAPADNLLLHVDQHADIGTPRLNQGLAATPPLEGLLEFCYDELSCFEFIIPALHQGLFRELVWLQESPGRPSDQLVVVRSPDGTGRSFDITGYDVLRGDPVLPATVTAGGRVVRYRHQSIREVPPPLSQVVLDIDLDYFSCEDAVNLSQKLEVTRAAYEAFHNDRYHFLRISQGSRIKMQEEDGRYYVYLRHYPEPLPTPLRVSEAVIEERLDAFTAYLERHAVRPQIIASARSRFSGYTPADQWQFIEAGLIRRLGGLYDLEVVSLDQIDPGRSGATAPPRPGRTP